MKLLTIVNNKFARKLNLKKRMKIIKTTPNEIAESLNISLSDVKKHILQ